MHIQFDMYVFRCENGLSIIGEVQLQDNQLYQLKLKVGTLDIC